MQSRDHAGLWTGPSVCVRDDVIDGHRIDLDAHAVGLDRVLLRLPHRDLDVTDTALAPPGAAEAAGAGVLVAPLHGAVTAGEVEVGDHVEVGDRIIAVEAMKMEHQLVADVAGTVTELAGVGDQVATDTVLACIEPA